MFTGMALLKRAYFSPRHLVTDGNKSTHVRSSFIEGHFNVSLKRIYFFHTLCTSTIGVTRGNLISLVTLAYAMTTNK